MGAGRVLRGEAGFAAKTPYAAIEKAQTPEATFEAATRFLEVHGAKGGELVDKAAAVFRDETVKVRGEKQLCSPTGSWGTWRNRQKTDDPEAYRDAWDAMAEEKAGRLDSAAGLWVKVKERFSEEAKLPFATNQEQLAKARWGWVADKRLADIAAAKAALVSLNQDIEDSRRFEQPLTTDPGNPESLAIRALRLHALGDDDRAARVCDSLISLTEKDPEKRAWYLLGFQIKSKLNKSADDPSKARLTLLDELLNKLQDQANGLKKDPDRMGGSALMCGTSAAT